MLILSMLIIMITSIITIMNTIMLIIITVTLYYLFMGMAFVLKAHLYY